MTFSHFRHWDTFATPRYTFMNIWFNYLGLHSRKNCVNIKASLHTDFHMFVVPRFFFLFWILTYFCADEHLTEFPEIL